MIKIAKSHHQVSEAFAEEEGVTTYPRSSPWGKPQTCDKIAPGIVRVTTAGHGGIHLDDWRQSRMPEALKNQVENWYEEDLCWCLPATAFPEAFPESYKKDAEWTLRNNFPERYEAYYNVVLEPGQSRDKDQKKFYLDNMNHYLATSACCHEQALLFHRVQIAEDMVLVHAAKGVGVEKVYDQKLFAVAEDRYKARVNTYIIDLEVDKML